MNDNDAASLAPITSLAFDLVLSIRIDYRNSFLFSIHNNNNNNQINIKDCFPKREHSVSSSSSSRFLLIFLALLQH